MPSNSHTDDTCRNQTTGTLYVVATPIGHRDDITLRALETLKTVDLIAAEDTRHTARFLNHHHIQGKLISYHEHNENERTPWLLQKMSAGLDVALVSDAGTPTVSDPGYRLITAAIAKDMKVIPLPGPSAIMAAVSAAGLPTDAFVFVGFLSKKKQRRYNELQALADEQRTVIFYESPARLMTLLQELIEWLGNRSAVLAREMTKQHEEFIRGNLSDIRDQLASRPKIRGECTLLVTGCTLPKSVSMELIRQELQEGLRMGKCRPSELSKKIAIKYSLSKRIVYSEALKIKQRRNNNSR